MHQRQGKRVSVGGAFKGCGVFDSPDRGSVAFVVPSDSDGNCCSVASRRPIWTRVVLYSVHRFEIVVIESTTIVREGAGLLDSLVFNVALSVPVTSTC